MSINGNVNGTDCSLEDLAVHSLYISESPGDESRTPSTVEAWAYDSCSSHLNHIPDTPVTKFQRDLMDAFEVSDVWATDFGDDKESVHLGWKKYLKNVFGEYEKYMKSLKEVENDLNDKVDGDGFLDTSSIIERSNRIDVIYTKIEEPHEEYTNIIRTLSTASHYFPRGIHREKMEEMIREIRIRHFDLLQLLHRKKLIFSRIIRLLQLYKSSGSELTEILDSLEASYEVFISQYNNSLEMSPIEDYINNIIAELKLKKSVIADFNAAGNGIIDSVVDHQFQIDELRGDMEDTVKRWDMLCLNIEKSLRHIKMEKSIAALAKKSDEEKIDFKIRDEFHMCTCDVPFEIIKVADGKYTFGSSKTVRLLRINGSSIVVRVGGGWQYLYDFLLKVDPCRAKQHADGASLQSLQSSGVTFTTLDKKNSEFTMSVKRMNRSSWMPSRYLTRKGDSTDGPPQIHKLNERAESSDSLKSSDTPSPKQNKRSKSRLSSSATRRSSEKTPTTRRSIDSSQCVSTGNIHRKSLDAPRRMSLMDRQKLYAEKRMRSTENLLD